MPPRPKSSASTTTSAAHTDLTSHADFKDLTDTDFVVQTSDGSKFPVLRAVLAANSLVFRDALKSDEGASKKDKQGRPIMMTPDEKAEDVELFLRFLVPELKRPAEPTLDQFFVLLHFAKKFDCPHLVDEVRSHKAYDLAVRDDPARTFGFAAADGHCDLAIAALGSLNFIHTPSLHDVPDVYRERIDPVFRCKLYELQLKHHREGYIHWYQDETVWREAKAFLKASLTRSFVWSHKRYKLTITLGTQQEHLA